MKTCCLSTMKLSMMRAVDPKVRTRVAARSSTPEADEKRKYVLSTLYDMDNQVKYSNSSNRSAGEPIGQVSVFQPLPEGES